MSHLKRPNDAMHWFLNELTSRIVAESGIPNDKFHLGKIILQSLKDAPNFVLQIDGATGTSMTNQEVLERSVRCATAFKNYGLGVGDVIVLMAPNHLHLAIPYYAALYLGIAIATIDWTFTVDELLNIFKFDKPKIIFCQGEKAPDVQLSLNSLGLDAHNVTFDGGRNLFSFDDFLDKYADETPVDQFRIEHRLQDFNPEEAIAFLLLTSGTTSAPKTVALTHKNMCIAGFNRWAKSTNFPTPTRMALVLAPLQWVTSIITFTISPILRYTRLQTSASVTERPIEHSWYLINKYKPTHAILNPLWMAPLMNFKDKTQHQCDLSCFETLMFTGCAPPPVLIQEIKRISPNTEVYNTYGMTELSGLGFHADDDAPPGSCGQPLGCHFYRIVDEETQKDITEPMIIGELWVAGPGVFKGYYNNPEATEEAFAEGKWFKTGDLFYRDENWNFFHVERIKLLLKYKGYHITPVELESVICQHPGVMEVAVTGIRDPKCGDLAVACVVRRPGSRVTAQDIKDLVKESLPDSKQLRGGVIFLDDLPKTASMKVQKRKLKEIVINTPRE